MNMASFLQKLLLYHHMLHAPYLPPNIQGVTTLRRAVSGEKQNSSRNLEILPGIGRLEKFSGRDENIPGHGTQFFILLGD